LSEPGEDVGIRLLLPLPDELRDAPPTRPSEPGRRGVHRPDRGCSRAAIRHDELRAVARPVPSARVEDDRDEACRRRRRRRQAKDLPVGGVRDVDVPARVLADIRHGREGSAPRRHPLRAVVARVGGRSAEELHGQELAGAEIGEEVAPRDLGHRRPARDDAPRHRAAPRAPGVLVLEDRQDERAGLAAGRRVVAAAPLHASPAVVLAPLGGGRLPVDLLPRPLADVPDEEVARRPVERIAPRVPEPLRPDLGQRARPPRERVVGRDGVFLPRVLRVDVDAQHLPEPGPVTLRVVLRVAPAPSVAEADPERPVEGREREVPAVVVREGLNLAQEDALAPGVGAIGVGRDPQLETTVRPVGSV
jgi:hypothetical protein